MVQESNFTSDVDAVGEAFDSPKSPSPPGRAAAFFLFWTGVAVAGLGLSLPLAHYVSLPDWGIRERLDALGFENGELFVGGLVLLAMGLVVRATVRAARFRPSGDGESPQSNEDFMLVADQLASDLSRVLSSVAQVSEQVALLSDNQQALLQAQEKEAEPSDQQHNAIFRLAASLDKLNAHIDERIHGLDTRFESQFQGMANAFQETRTMLETKLAAATQAPAAPAAAAPAAPQAPAPPPSIYDAPPPEPGMVNLGDEEPSIELFDAMDAIEHGQTPGHPNPPFPQGGDLDSLLPDDSIQRARDQGYGH